MASGNVGFFADKTMELAALVLFHRRPPEDRVWLLMTNTQSIPSPMLPTGAPFKVVFPKLALIGTCLNLEDFFKVQ